MHEYVAMDFEANQKAETDYTSTIQKELFVGDVIQAAIHNDIKVDTVIFTDGKYLDVGTPEGMIKAYQIERQGWGD